MVKQASNLNGTNGWQTRGHVAPYDFAVVGGGIAGIAAAELLARSGQNVILLEAGSQFVSGASASQQGWAHTGALYAALPTSRYIRALLRNASIWLSYYRSFDRMNLEAGRPLSSRAARGWFRNITNWYFYLDAWKTPGIRPCMRPLWWLATQRAKIRLARIQSIDLARPIDTQLRLLDHPRHLLADSGPHFPPRLAGEPRGIALPSQDRTLCMEAIAEDLLASFLASGGEFRLKTRVAALRRGEVITDDKVYLAKRTIVCTGRAIGELTDVPVKVVKSPLLVTRPSLSESNLCVMAPTMELTFNHLFQAPDPADGYAVMGNASYYPADANVDDNQVMQHMLDHVRRIFGVDLSPGNCQLYFGYKTETPGLGQLRNYQYQIHDAGHAIVCLPGKATLAFSMAHQLCRSLGIDPVTHVPELNRGAVSSLVSPTQHRQASMELGRRAAGGPRAKASVLVGSSQQFASTI